MITPSFLQDGSPLLTEPSQKYIDSPRDIENGEQAIASSVISTDECPSMQQIDRSQWKLKYSLNYSQSHSIRTVETTWDELQALRQHARQSPRQTAQVERSSQKESQLSAFDLSGSHAAPLSPLRDRDNTALSTLFLRVDMPEVEADINHRLLSLLPEPCWEDDPVEFLQEFL